MSLEEALLFFEYLKEQLYSAPSVQISLAHFPYNVMQVSLELALD